ncbi:hypothetical protein [Listeria welshimeri]|uniref:hypothetical protein n=1 Tax=Listeria welshimeri TaxID=1643 RepID=UPI0016234808|nr:hypothetical protein [Listeria welshimeri]MBC2009991.1 hypothetical protein [Listeria welshimeri]MBF2677370.1 hypothetical protein [Listeria welshimeri]
MKKLIFLLIICSCIVVGCASEDFKVYRTKSFQYGEIVEIEEGDKLQLFKDSLYLIPEVTFPENDLRGQVEFRKINPNLLSKKSTLLELTNLEYSIVRLRSFSSGSNPSGELTVFNSNNQVGIIESPEKYIPISPKMKQEKGDYIGTGTFTNGENVIMFFEETNGIYTLTRWDEQKKINKEATLTAITKEKNLSVENMAVFEDEIYVYSYKSNKVYVISQDLKLLHAWNIEGEMRKVVPEKWGSSVGFAIQRELNELFIYNYVQPEQGIYKITKNGLKKLEYGQEKYKDMYLCANGRFNSLYEKQIIPIDSNEVYQKVLTADGDYYFTTSKDLSHPQKEPEEGKVYLNKVSKKKLPSFIDSLKSKE